MLKPEVTDVLSSGGAFSEDSGGPTILIPASLKLNGALDRDPPRCRFSPKVVLSSSVGEAVKL